MNKRDFLKTFGTAAIGSPFLSLDLSSNHKFEDYSKRNNLSKTDFWKKIREDYTLKKDYINLESLYNFEKSNEYILEAYNLAKDNSILITTGLIDFDLITDLKNNFFKKSFS